MIGKRVNLKERSKQKHIEFMTSLKKSFLNGGARGGESSDGGGSIYGRYAARLSKRLIPVVLSIDSINLHSGRFASLGAGDIEMEAELVYDAYADFDVDALVPISAETSTPASTSPTPHNSAHPNTSTTDTMLHTTVSGRLLDQAGMLILEVTPFIIRLPTMVVDCGADDDDGDEMVAREQSTSGMDNWSRAVREGLLLGIHPSLCNLYSKRSSKSALSPSPGGGVGVMLAAKAALGCPVDAGLWDESGGGGGTAMLVGWDIYTSTTALVQVLKEP